MQISAPFGEQVLSSKNGAHLLPKWDSLSWCEKAAMRWEIYDVKC